MKIATILGARPQFIKAAPISDFLNQNHSNKINEVLIHTGQHFDSNMSDIFFKELKIPKPKYNLGISGGTHGQNTGRMIEAIEKVLLIESPDIIMLYGDTDSTLSGAIASSKLNIPIAHIESGLRSFNLGMPEEINRIVTDRLSSILFCTSHLGVINLKKEGIDNHVYDVGDVMYDIFLKYARKEKNSSKIIKLLNIKEKEFILTTIHRQENVDNIDNLLEILRALYEISLKIKVVLPIHPRLKKIINESSEIKYFFNKFIVIDPVSYFDMIKLQSFAYMIITDSGGIQKEAYFSNIPCITLRNETEWVETLELKRNILAGADKERILQAYYFFNEFKYSKPNIIPYGDGHAAEKIVRKLIEFMT